MGSHGVGRSRRSGAGELPDCGGEGLWFHTHDRPTPKVSGRTGDLPGHVPEGDRSPGDRSNHSGVGGIRDIQPPRVSDFIDPPGEQNSLS